MSSKTKEQTQKEKKERKQKEQRNDAPALPSSK